MWCRRLIRESFSSKGNLSTLLTQSQQQQRSFRGRQAKPRMVSHGSPDPEPRQDLHDSMKKEKRKAPLTKMLDNAGTFHDVEVRSSRPAGTTLPTEDPFLSSPYTKETKIFVGGENAADEANRRQLGKVEDSSIIIMKI